MRGLRVDEIPIEAKLAAQGFDLAFLSGVDDAVRTVEGHLDADARLTGRVGAPQLVGKLGWKAGRVILAGFGELRDIELSAHGDPRQMVLDRLFARAGAGSATLSAHALRQADDHVTVEARADLDRFRLQTEGQPLGALSLKAEAAGGVTPERIEIAAKIAEAHMELAEGDRRSLQSLKRPDDVVLLSNGEPIDKTQARRYDKLVKTPPAPPSPAAPPPPPSGQGALPNGKPQGVGRAVVAAAKAPVPPAELKPSRVRLTVDAPRNLWVRGADANLEVGLEPGFLLLQGDETRIFGTVKVKRGFVEVLGRRFDVNPGSSVRFTGPSDQPSLDIDATYKATLPEGTAQVVVHIEGATDKLSFTLRSPEHPELGDSDLMTLVATGRLPGERSTGAFNAEGKAASLVGGLVAARVQKALTNHLPIDVLTIEPGESVTRLEAGAYLRDDVYVAYVGRVGADPTLGRENRNEVHLEYQLTPRWSFEATYGDARRGSVDLLWTRSY
jgi:translocation and assembly module TamB